MPKLLANPQVTRLQLLEMTRSEKNTLERLDILEAKLLQLFHTNWGEKKVKIWWHSEGTSGGVPSTPIASYPGVTVREVARIDVYRGVPADDPGNAVLALMMKTMPRVWTESKYNYV